MFKVFCSCLSFIRSHFLDSTVAHCPFCHIFLGRITDGIRFRRKAPFSFLLSKSRLLRLLRSEYPCLSLPDKHTVTSLLTHRVVSCPLNTRIVRFVNFGIQVLRFVNILGIHKCYFFRAHLERKKSLFDWYVFSIPEAFTSARIQNVVCFFVLFRYGPHFLNSPVARALFWGWFLRRLRMELGLVGERLFVAWISRVVSFVCFGVCDPSVRNTRVFPADTHDTTLPQRVSLNANESLVLACTFFIPVLFVGLVQRFETSVCLFFGILLNCLSFVL